MVSFTIYYAKVRIFQLSFSDLGHVRGIVITIVISNKVRNPEHFIDSKYFRFLTKFEMTKLIYFSVEGQTKAVFGTAVSLMDLKPPSTFMTLSNPLAFRIEAAIMER